MWFGTNTEYKKKVKEFQEELYSYGIQEADLQGLPLEYWQDMVEAFEIIYKEFPILQNSIKRIRYFMHFFDIGNIRFPDENNYTYEVFQTLNLNYLLKFKGLFKIVSNMIIKSGSSLMCNVRYIVIHELAHELEFLLTQKFYGIVFDDESVKRERFEALAGCFKRCEFIQLVLESAFGVKYIKKLPAIENCKYAFENSSEFMAEMLGIYFTAENPVEYSVKFYEGLKYIIRLYKLS